MGGLTAGRRKVAGVAALLVALVAWYAVTMQLLDRPSTTTLDGVVVKVSSDNQAVVVETDDGRVDGLLATDQRLSRGDRVRVTVFSTPDILYVERRRAPAYP